MSLNETAFLEGQFFTFVSYMNSELNPRKPLFLVVQNKNSILCEPSILLNFLKSIIEIHASKVSSFFSDLIDIFKVKYNISECNL